MKKILYTLFTLLVMVSCNQDEIDISASLKQESGEKVKLTFNVSIPEAQKVESRAFGKAPTLSSLWLVLFDEQGYYVGKAQAKNASANSTTIDGVNKDNETSFYVELDVTESPRIIHFIGNYDLADATLAGHENAIISRLNVTGGQDAYWQRINVDEIKKKTGATADDNDLFEGDIPTTMKPVYLLRNFAKITVTNEVSTFTYQGFDIITTESHGSVAPYMGTGSTSFPVFIGKSYDDLLGSGYTGFTPGSSQEENTFNKDTKSFSVEPSFSTESQYLYERNNQDGQTYVIVKGQWNGQDTYYKIDLIRTVQGSAVTYYHILRNFHYNIKIKKVEGAGYGSPEAAAAGAASNNIFASVELQHLTNIGTGKARLFVNYASKTLISNAPVTLEYRFVDEDGKDENSRIQIEGGAGEVIARISEPVHDSDAVENAGYSYITITPNNPGTLSKEQSITLYDSETGLQRKIVYTLRNAYPLDVTCSSNVAPLVGSPVEVTIKIDAGLPDYLFPLTFYVESSKLSIYPDANKSSMPVHTRETVVEGKKGNSFGYDRVLSLTEYEQLEADAVNGKVSIPCLFFTNMANSASDIYVYNELFALRKVSLTNNANLFLFTFGKMSGGSNAPTIDTTLITIYSANGNSVLGSTTWGELKAGTTKIAVDKNTYDTTVDQNNQNNSLCYFAYEGSNGQVYKTDPLNVNQAKSRTQLNFKQ